MIVENALASFRRLLESAWADINSLELNSGQQGLTADWMQASWEAVVEASLCGQFGRMRLLVYGDGADCHPRSSRFSYPNDLPTHRITCRPADRSVTDLLTGTTLPEFGSIYVFDRFVSVSGGWYYEKPPFDHVLLDAGREQYLVRADRLMWELSECGVGDA